ncbi:MAG: hypothetical protein HY926_07440, partial [Elusimicrobia bacterium]|nr:hypothetical protein [Elusimicrobiota bacterium]
GSTTAWSFTFPAAGWTSGDTYVAYASATDLANNWQLGISSQQFTYDVGIPTAVFTTPGPSGYLNAFTATISGTADETPAGIAAVNVALSSANGAGGWWNGTDFVGAAADYAGGFSLAGYNGITKEWTWNLPPANKFADGVGTYLVGVRSLTNAGTSRTQYSYSGFNWNFSYDETEPGSGIAAPVNGSHYSSLATITGTSSDNLAVSTVSLVVRDLSVAGPNNCWQPGAGAFNQACTPFPAQGNPCVGASCDWHFDGIPWTAAVPPHTFLVISSATDRADNEQDVFAVTVSSAAFVYDTQVPTVKILFPADSTRQQSLLTVTGTAAETAPGQVAAVQLRFHQLNFPANYADPSNPLDFGSAIPAENAWFNANSTTTVPWFTWSATSGTLTNFTPGATYTIEARAVNMSGSYSTAYSTVAVVWDNGSYSGTPQSAVTYPVNAAWMSSLPSITGTAADLPAGNPGVIQGVGLQLVHRNPPASECSGAGTCWWTGGAWSQNPAILQQPTVNVQVFQTSWSLTSTLPAPASLVSGGTYYITSASTDNAKPTGNMESFFTPARASTFTVDLDAPASSFTAPLNGQVLPSLTQLAGTAFDPLSGIPDNTHIWVAMEEVWPGGACWDGNVQPAGTFTVAGCPALSNWYRIDQGGRGGAYNPVSKAWTVNAPTLSAQYVYRVWVRASDSALPTNKLQSDVAASSITFTYDPNVPGAGLTYPAAGGTFIKGAFTVTGTASNLAFAIKYASVAFQEADTGNYYDIGSGTFSAVSAGKPGQNSWLGAAVTPGGGGPPYLAPFNWSVAAPCNFGPVAAYPCGYQTTGRQYKAYVTAITEAGNEINWISPNEAFVYDTIAPASRPAYPADGSFRNNISSVTGTAADPGAGASGIAAPGGTQIQVQRNPAGSGPCWDGAGWNDGSCGQASWLGVVAGTPWNKTTQLPLSNNNPVTGFVDGLQYKVFSRAYDVAHNTETVTAGNLFTFDISSPTALIQSPADGSIHSSLALISGTAKDASNARFPDVRIYRSGSYWNSVSKLFDINEALAETAWNVAAGSSSVNSLPDGFTWSYDVSSVTQTWAGAYQGFRVDVRVRDEAGNYSMTTATFTFDRSAPVSNVTFPPAPDGLFFSSMTALWGDSLDDAAGVAQVLVRMWYLSAGTTYYWNKDLQMPGNKHWTTTDSGFFLINNSAGGLGTGGVPNTWSYNSVQNPDFNNPASNFYAWKQATHDGLTGKTFYIQTVASDYAGNVETHISTRSFVFNNVPPTSGPSLPSPYQAYTSGQLATITGTAAPATGTIAGVAVSILSLDEPGGAQWLDFGTGLFNKPFQAGAWQNLLPGQVFQSSWSFNPPPAIFVDARHYVVYSTATDNIGNVQTGVGDAEILFDSTTPTSQVTWPPTAGTKDNGLVPSGISSDWGYTSSALCGAPQVQGQSGSGVYPVCGWQDGKVEVAVYRDTMPITAPELIFPGPAAYGAWGNQGFWWDFNTSTWVPASSVGSPPLWAPAAFNSSAGAWQFASLVCPNPNPLDVPCWHNGNRYAVWSRVTDNAGNAQSVMLPAPVFFIAAPAASFALSIDSNPSTAGSAGIVDLTVTAVDGPNGTGGTAAGYAQTVKFSIDGGGPETMGDGLPLQHTFTVGALGDNGSRTFPITLRKAGGARVLRVAQLDDSISGMLPGVQVQHAAPAKVQIIADADPLGQQPGPGVTTAGSEGRIGAPRNNLSDGVAVQFLAQVVDAYWNLVVSSAVTLTVDNSDPYSFCIPGNNPNLAFVGSTTFNWAFGSAGPQNLWATGAGIYPNASNPSSAVGITGQSASRLVVTLPGEIQVQGKSCGAGAPGKTGTPADLLAGQVYVATVTAVDDYYNTANSAGYNVQATVYTDPYAQPAVQSKNLFQGTTQFIFTPVTAAPLALEAKTGSLPAATSAYDTADYAPLSPVWWEKPAGLQLIVEGQQAGPGVPGAPAYQFGPTSGGRAVTTPATLVAGVTSYITVSLVDQFYNVVKSSTAGTGRPSPPFMTASQLNSSNTLVAQISFPNDANVQAWYPEGGRYSKALVAGTTTFGIIPVTRNPNPGLTIQAADSSLGQFPMDAVSGIQVDANPTPAALQLLVPTEAAVEGSTYAKTGTAGPLIAGQPYSIEVRSVDRYWNKTTDGRSVGLSCNDAYATLGVLPLPQAQPLANGTTVFSNFIPSIATGNLVVTAYDNSGGGLPGQADSDVDVVPGQPARFMVVLPGQSLSGGKTTPPVGVSGPAAPQKPGPSNAFSVSVYATDLRYNWTPSGAGGEVTNSFQLTSNDPNSGNPFAPASNIFSLANGSAALTGVTLYTASTVTLTATNQGGPYVLAAGASGGVVVDPFIVNKLRVLLPQCASDTVCPPGTAHELRIPGDHTSGPALRGRVAAPLIIRAGVDIPVTVDITDAYWNLVPGATQEVRLTVPSDPYAEITPPFQEISTSGVFTVKFHRALPQTIHAEITGNPLYPGNPSADDSTQVTVNAGAPQKFLAVVAPETFDQGSVTNGKTGTPAQQTAGQAALVTAGIVDSYFNLVPGVASDVETLPSDNFALHVDTLPINTVTGKTVQFSVTLLHAATGHFLRARDYTGASGLTDDVSSTFTVRAAPPVGFQLVLPGQTVVGGAGDYFNGQYWYNRAAATPTAGV